MVSLSETRENIGGEEVTRIMDGVYGRLVCGVEAQVLKGFPGGAETTSIARSETFVASKQLETLNKQVETTRQELFAGGKNGTVHPWYKKWIEARIKTEEECRQFYWDRAGSLTFAANQSPAAEPREFGNEKLWISTDKKRGKISLVDISLRFDGTFTMIIGFQGRQAVVTYRVLRLPMERMTDEEYKIIKFYLNQYPV